MATVLSLNNGLRITGVPFVLDASRPERFAFASHAHADHCSRHRKILCTPATAELARLRFGKTDYVTLRVGEVAEIDNVTVELFDAGHVLGSAQIMMIVEGKRILYTGDLKPAGGRTTPPAPTPACDILIIEVTYGRPEYVFPSTEKAVEMLVSTIKRAFVRGLTPVLLAYGLGKAQEVMALLEDQGFTFACHRLIHDLVKIYRRYGVPLPGAELFAADRLAGKIVVLPPGMSKCREWKFIKNPYTIFLSGWALDSARRPAVDVTLPLSDHADYPQLIEFIAGTGARTVYTFHGFPELSHQLRENGLTSRHLERKDVIDLLTGDNARPGAMYDLFGQRAK
jgi:putative mRNA 3-end processing factor